MVTMVLVGGLYNEYLALAYGIIVIFSRLGYALMYARKGPKSRLPYGAAELIPRFGMLIYLTIVLIGDFASNSNSQSIFSQ